MLPMQYSPTEIDQQRITNNCKTDMGPVKLLVSTRLVEDAMLDKATKLSYSQRRPVGDILVDLKVISNDLLQAVLLAQALVNQGQLRPSQATMAIQQYVRSEQNIVAIINELTGSKSELVNDLGLGALLIAAEVMTVESYRQAISESKAANLPLGKTILGLKVLTLASLDSALYLSNHVHSGAMDLGTAAKVLKKAVVNNRPARELELEARLFNSPVADGPMLGGFLVQAGVIKDIEMVEALETSLLHRNRIGEILVQQGALTRDLLDGAVKLQRMVVCGMLRLDDGLKCLRRAKMAASGSREIIHNAAKLVCCMEGASELASHTGLLKQDLDLTTKLMQDISGLAALEALFVAHDLPYNLYRVLVQASQLVEISAIDQGQAIQVVDVCERTRCSFDEAIAELGLGIYEANDEDVTQDQVAKPASRPRLLDGSSAMQLLFYFCAALAAVAVIHYQLLPQFHVLAMVVVSSVLLTFSASTLDGAFKRCRKEAYEQEVNSEAAVLTKDKLKTLRTSQRLSRF